MQDIAIICQDLFGIEVYSLICEINKRERKLGNDPVYNVIGFVSYHNDTPFGEIDPPAPVICDIDQWYPAGNERAVMGVLDPIAKERIVKMFNGRGVQFETIIAPWSLADKSLLKIGKGCIFAPYSTKMWLEIGDYVTLVACMIDGYKINDYSTILRFSNIVGNEIGKYSFLGNHVFLASGEKIGDRCYVADGSVIVKSIKSGVRVSGVPAVRIRK